MPPPIMIVTATAPVVVRKVLFLVVLLLAGSSVNLASAGSAGYNDWCLADRNCQDGMLCINSGCRDGRIGDPCYRDEACRSNDCSGGFKCRTSGGYGTWCSENAHCNDDLKCLYGKCLDGRDGDSCWLESHCQSGRCDRPWFMSAAAHVYQQCMPRKESGYCNEDSDCKSNCYLFRCCKGYQCRHGG